MTGLRERKKSETRQHIADVAARLFAEHGFDEVTVDQVAQAADVAKKTVFNYFPTKEDLVFDRAEDRASALLAAVTGRDAHTSVLESFRELCLSQAERLGRLRAEVESGTGGPFELMRTNPALRRKMHEVNAELTALLAAALAAEAGTTLDDPVTLVVAGALIGAQRTLYIRLREHAAGPASDASVIRQHRRDTDRVFDQLSQGLSAYPVLAGEADARRTSGA
jgi:AcrR family transcriptional regulator